VAAVASRGDAVLEVEETGDLAATRSPSGWKPHDLAGETATSGARCRLLGRLAGWSFDVGCVGIAAAPSPSAARVIAVIVSAAMGVLEPAAELRCAPLGGAIAVLRRVAPIIATRRGDSGREGGSAWWISVPNV
jgi:hypothetical protein